MKTLDENATANMTEEEADDFYHTFQWADHWDTEEFFTSFDHLLAEHGLELVYFNSGSCSHAFRIEKRVGDFRVVEYVGDMQIPDQELWNERYLTLEEALEMAKTKYEVIAESDAGEEDFKDYEVVVQNDDGRVFHRVQT